MLDYDPFQSTGSGLYETYDRLRSEQPVYWAEVTGAFVLSRYDDVAWALAETDRFSSDAMRGVLLGFPTGSGSTRLPRADAVGMVVSVDPPEHSDLRRIVSRGFTPRTIAGWRERIDSLVSTLLDRTAGEPSFDVIAQLASPLPVRVIAELIGADPDQADRFRTWAGAMTRVMSGSARATGLQAEEAVAMLELASAIGELIDDRHEHPQDDLLTTLVKAQADGLSREEAVGFAALLLFAGTETTTNLIGNTVAALLQHPDELDHLRSDAARLPAVMEETLRWESPVQYVFRRTTAPIERHGVEMPVDSIVTLLLGAANRDPSRWGPDAAAFRPDRDTSGHLAFGFGPHFCLGAALARLEASSALTAILPRIAPAVAPADGDWVDSMQFRGRQHLPVRLSAPV